MGKPDVRARPLVAERSDNSVRICNATVVERYAVDTTAIEFKKCRLRIEGRPAHPSELWYDSSHLHHLRPGLTQTPL